MADDHAEGGVARAVAPLPRVPRRDLRRVFSRCPLDTAEFDSGWLARGLCDAARLANLSIDLVPSEGMLQPTVRLLPVDDDVLEDLLAAAVADADPEEAMPPVAGPPGWTAARREAFRAFHRDRRDGLVGPRHEVTFAVVADGEIVGSARLERKRSPATLEAGLWLARSVRGRGIGTAVLRALLDEAAAAGAHTVIAETTESNAPALGALRGIGARLMVDDASGQVHAHLPVARQPPRQ